MMANSQRLERRVVHYEGRVQGVGFRFRTQAIAARHDVSGFVKNLPDGRVQLVAEGDAGELDRFLAEVAEEMRGNIHEMNVITREATGEFRQFSIQR